MNTEKLIIGILIICIFGIMGFLFRNDEFGSNFRSYNLNPKGFEIYRQLKIYKDISRFFFGEMLVFIFLLIIDFNIEDEYFLLIGFIPLILTTIITIVKCVLYKKNKL